MIGGTDFIFPLNGKTIEFAVLTCIEIATKNWPNANIFFSNDIKELFICRDSNIYKIWFENGMIPEIKDLVLHILCSSDSLTIVSDSEDNQLLKLIKPHFIK